MIPVLLALALMQTMPPRTPPADWNLVGTTSSTRSYINAASIRQQGGLIVAEGLAVFQINGDFSRALAYSGDMEFDCANRRIRDLGGFEYRVGGARNLRVTPDTNPPVGARTVRPGSMDAQTLNYICGTGSGQRVPDPIVDAARAWG